ncbi:MAG: hypothetical protein EOO06_21430 [Chitinophagaceae bacterium]|nr:MAG: hypothetical protein EOO06_21430 [Chitinophagaceae bacterium]
MTIEQFAGATPYVQRTMVKFHGTFQLEKSLPTGSAKLYQIDDFYVEVVLSSVPYSLPTFECFSYNDIDDYLCMVDISGLKSLLT